MVRRISLFLRICGVASVLLFAVDCSKSESDKSADTNPPVAATLTNLYSAVFSQGCKNCHNPATTVANAGSSNLDFSTITMAYTTLQGFVSGLSTAGHCNNVKIVKPSDAANSYLAAVLFTDYDHANFGGQTGCIPITEHQLEMHLTPNERAALLAWINAGAINN